MAPELDDEAKRCKKCGHVFYPGILEAGWNCPRCGAPTMGWGDYVFLYGSVIFLVLFVLLPYIDEVNFRERQRERIDRTWERLER